MNKQQSVKALIFMVIILVSVIAPVEAGKYAEYFTTNQYKDFEHTSACWDINAGELKLWPHPLSVIGSYAGNCSCIAVEGRFAYANMGHNFTVFDISDPETPTMRGSCGVSGSFHLKVVIQGNYAYVAGFMSGLSIINISNPDAPTVVGHYNSVLCVAVDVEGKYAYLQRDDGDFIIIDITDPTHPIIVRAVDLLPGSGIIRGIQVLCGNAYVAVENYGLQIIDVSNPLAPFMKGYSPVWNSIAVDVVVHCGYAYLPDGVDGPGGTAVIDVRDPANPVEAGGAGHLGSESVAIDGDYLYVGGRSSGLMEWSLEPNPLLPEYIRSNGIGGEYSAIAVQADKAYVANGAGGLMVVDLADPVLYPETVGSYLTNGANDLDMACNLLYVANRTSGLRIFNVHNPVGPIEVGSIVTVGLAMDVVADCKYAYVACWDNGLQIIDISDPANPNALGDYNPPGQEYGVYFDGKYAYVASRSGGFHVIDVSDPEHPTLAGGYDTSGDATSVYVAGGYAYVTDGPRGLDIYDVSNLPIVSYKGNYNTPGNAWEVVVVGNYAYVADGSSGLQVINVSNPLSPSYVGSYNTPVEARGITVTGNYAFIADGWNGGLIMLDISDRTNPQLLANYETDNYSLAVAVEDDYAYVANYVLGIKAVEVFQRRYDSTRNKAQSIKVVDNCCPPPGQSYFMSTIEAVLISTTQATDGIKWEVSSNGGANWQEVTPNTGSWTILSHTGKSLKWRSTHYYDSYKINPVCSDLEIEYWLKSPWISVCADVSGDQGRELQVAWYASSDDREGSTTTITEYAIYRKIDPNLSAARRHIPSDKDIINARVGIVGTRECLTSPPGDWDYITSVPATMQDEYSAIVPTLKDSTIAEGMYYTVFFVRAFTDTVGVYYDALPDSGYSVDNVPPSPIAGFSVAYNTGYGNKLLWRQCTDIDFQNYNIYRDEIADFIPGAANLVHSTVDSTWIDTVEEGWRYYYKVAAIDSSGNMNDPRPPETVTESPKQSLPRAYALHQNMPNPFNPITRIRFDLPEAAVVRLVVYNVNGQMIRVLANGEIAAGSREVVWDGRDAAGRATASGIYFYRIDAGRFTETKKMILLR